jgi:hypothetical protein
MATVVRILITTQIGNILVDGMSSFSLERESSTFPLSMSFFSDIGEVALRSLDKILEFISVAYIDV